MALATENSELVLAKIKELPPLPLVVQKLLKVLDDPDSSAEDVSQVLSSDQAMAAKILRLVNSSFYGLSGQVNTISRAVVILGMSTIRNLALGLSVAGFMTSGGQGEVQSQFWDHALTTAAAAKALAKRYGSLDPEEAYIAGLMHDLGHLVFLLALPKEFMKIMAGDPSEMLAKETEILGISHCKAGQKLFKHWKLPRSLEQVARFHHTSAVITGKDDPLVSMVALAETLAIVHGRRYEGSISESDFTGLVKVTGLEVEELAEVLVEITGLVEGTRLFLQVATDEEIDQMVSEPVPPLEIVLICTDQIKAEWIKQIMEHYGHEMTPMKQFFAQASSGELPDLAILDPVSVTAEQLAKMKPVLDLMGEDLVLLGDENHQAAMEILGKEIRQLPMGFCQQDLELESV